MKRLTNGDAVRIKTEKAEYIATVERIKNDINGNPRYEIMLICLASEYNGSFYCPKYRTGAFYETTKEVAESVARAYEDEKRRG